MMKRAIKAIPIFICYVLSLLLLTQYTKTEDNSCARCTLDTPYVHTQWQHPRGSKTHTRRKHYSPREPKYHGGRQYAKMLRKKRRNDTRCHNYCSAKN